MLLVFISETAQAQTPQYYNYNIVDGANSYPLNQVLGQRVQLLYRVGEFNNPTPVVPGYITSIAIKIASGYPLGPWQYNDFTIKMGLTPLTDLPAADFYTGSLSTVYFKDSVTLTGVAGDWMTIPLDVPFYYNNTQSLVVEVSQSSIDGSVSGYSWSKTDGAGYSRAFSSPGAPNTFSGADANQYHMGLNMTKNDSCIRAVNVLPGTTVYGTTTGALAQSVPDCNTVLSTAPGVWFKFTSTGPFSNVNTCTGTSFDSKIGVFTGDCDSLICIGGNDDNCGLQSSVNICSQPGIEYFVYVTGYSSSNGPFGLTVTSGVSAPPVFYSTPTTYVQASDPDECGAFVYVYTPYYGDDCGATITNDYTGTDDASAFYPVDTTLVTWQLIDSDSNVVSNYVDTIVVSDVGAPVLHCPADVVQSTDPGTCGAIVNYTPPVGIDNCVNTVVPIDLYHSNTQNIIQGIACSNGIVVLHNRLAVVFDLPALGYPSGLQTDTVDFAIYQATSPVGYQPAKINLYTLSGTMDVANLTLLDSMSIQIPNCNDTILSYPFSTFVPAGASLVYEIEVQDGTDSSNYMRIGTNLDGQSTPSYILAEDCGVNNFADLTAVCCTDAYVMNIHGVSGGGTALVSGIGSGGVYPVGTTTDVYQASDAAGNVSTCSVNITVVDEEAPAVTAPADITINADSCVVHNVGCSVQNGFAGAFDPYYWNFYQINADGYSDISGAPDTISMTGGNNMSDNEGFTNASIPVTCNGNITFNWDYIGGDSALYDVPQYSLTGGAPYTLLPGFFTTGPINQSGTAIIPVQDGQTFVLSLYTHDNMYGEATLTISDFSGPATAMPVFSDNCGIESVTSNHPSSEFEAGETVVTWTVTDIHGNTTNTDQIVTVNESIDPAITCPSNIEITTTSSVGEIYLYNVTASDNCALIDLTQTGGLPSGSQFPIGVTTNSWTATDASGNTSSCSFTVTVLDVTSLGESGESAVNVYPNPASEIVFAELPEGFTGTVVTLYSAEGAVVRSYGACNEKLVQFNISDLSDGVYFMKFENQNTSFYKKVVKN
ncbi:MAG: hypothetical protein A2W93_05160 [Bacteroidetes bacterium GWF2_43_63]|nr:MAG: hypothetical protein A2W94_11990 [Bacteroidetes bacterium GWE2_42_42]OFY56264.1 MAG: hypothetical protein A2W93_05160 [Bacteroidetes bacterium GWF2_43_63]